MIHDWIEFAASGVEALAVAIMSCFILIGTVRWLLQSVKKINGAYESYRSLLGRTLLIGLQLLVAADIINTVAFDLTLTNLALLGGLVLVRTVLGWTLTFEVEGRWPWQQPNQAGGESGNEAPQSTASISGQAQSGITQKMEQEYARTGY
jgi:uncharacterized membrane protein